jgi:energy-coupling factor transport system substrate-specific component
MMKYSVRSMGKTGTREFVSVRKVYAMIAGSLLYAALTIPFNVLPIPLEGGPVAVRPTVAIPMLFGFAFGPIIGFVSGLLGSIISDGLSFGGFFWNWEIGNGLLGTIPGIAYFVIKRADWTKARTLATVAILAIFASIVGIGFATMSDYIFQINLTTIDAALAEFYWHGATDSINGAILTPILVYAYGRATARRTRKV